LKTVGESVFDNCPSVEAINSSISMDAFICNSTCSNCPVCDKELLECLKKGKYLFSVDDNES
jgi:hypothetical protein